MSILERLNTLEERIEYYEGLISRIDNTLNEPLSIQGRIQWPKTKGLQNLEKL